MENPHLMEDLEEMDKMPIASDVCTLLRMGLYYVHAELCPRPTAYVGICEPCDGIMSIHQALTHHKERRDIPSFAPEPTYYQDCRGLQNRLRDMAGTHGS